MRIEAEHTLDTVLPTSAACRWQLPVRQASSDSGDDDGKNKSFNIHLKGEF
jgi:hypothetical protein